MRYWLGAGLRVYGKLIVEGTCCMPFVWGLEGWEYVTLGWQSEREDLRSR